MWELILARAARGAGSLLLSASKLRCPRERRLRRPSPFAKSTKRLEFQILKLNGFCNPYCQIKWTFRSMMTPIKSLNFPENAFSIQDGSRHSASLVAAAAEGSASASFSRTAPSARRSYNGLDLTPTVLPS
jgi:hypothetical protein